LTSLDESVPSSSCPTKLRATAMPIETPTAVEPEPATAIEAATTSAVIDELPVAVTVTSCPPSTSLETIDAFVFVTTELIETAPARRPGQPAEPAKLAANDTATETDVIVGTETTRWPPTSAITYVQVPVTTCQPLPPSSV